ncbi:PLAC8-domain-containing protein [Agrocybe pediades]|nr:PLAC8-domain-containing protein [Agrocybe pediades]
MSVGGGNRNVKNLPMNADGRAWSHGFCDCFGDCGTCVVACCCPCIVYGQVANRYEHLTQQGFPDPDKGGCCNSACMIHGLLTACLGAGFIMQFMKRGDIRSRYNISGGGCGDCMAAWCCAPCELTQESRELQLEEESFGGKQG